MGLVHYMKNFFVNDLDLKSHIEVFGLYLIKKQKQKKQKNMFNLSERIN